MDTLIQNNSTPLMNPDRDVPMEIPVLIVGGGPVGLSTSLMLSYHGVSSLLVEQHPGTSIFPKARLINARTMEIFRQLGIEPAIREISIPHTRALVITHSLAGKEIMSFPIETVNPEPVRDWSPTWGCTITQEVLEPVLLAQARRHKPAKIRFGMQLVSVEQKEDYVLATLVHRTTGRVEQLRASYLIGADGAHSTVREKLGIGMLGTPILNHAVNILFRADLSPWLRDREINIASITNPEAPGLLLYNGRDHWRYSAFYYPDRGQSAEDFTPEHSVQIVRMAVGAPDLKVELDDIKAWSDAALVAERFSEGRIFLAGDATHLMSPMGGFGMNVGIQDAHNLVWKLVAVIKGWGEATLLGSYETERTPVSRSIVEQMRRNAQTVQKVFTDSDNQSKTFNPTQAPPGRPELGREHGLVFGAMYDSAVIVLDGNTPMQVPDPIHEYLSNAYPGNRAPHVWLERQGERISTLDLFGREFVLLAGAQGQGWCEAAKVAKQASGILVKSFKVGPDEELADPDAMWAKIYGVGEDGAVLVRPDGYVAWRCATARASAVPEMEAALMTALARLPVRKFEAA